MSTSTTAIVQKTPLQQLHGLPIFRLSLGSKELFHSNFLEYLWDVDKGSFIKMINAVFGKAVLANQGVKYWVKHTMT